MGDAHRQDRSLPAYTFICLLFLRAGMMARHSAKAATGPSPANGHGLSAGAERAVRGFALFAVLYAIVLPTLGFMDLGSANM